MTTLKRTLLFFTCILPVFWLLLLTGCGGGSDDSMGTMSPEELEVATVIDAFTAAVNATDVDTALTYAYSNLRYYGGPSDSQVLKYEDLKTRLSNFFVLATSFSLEIRGLGITLESETLASARGQLILDYKTGSGEDHLYETIEMKLQKDGKNWGILELAQYGSSGTTATQFPPIK